MASAAYRFRIAPSDQGASSSTNTIVRGIVKTEGIPHDVVVQSSNAQIQGLLQYIALINAGVGTGTVEAAITALAP